MNKASIKQKYSLLIALLSATLVNSGILYVINDGNQRWKLTMEINDIINGMWLYTIYNVYILVWSEWVGEWVDDVWLRERKSEWMSDWKRRFKEIYTDLIWILTLACV